MLKSAFVVISIWILLIKNGDAVIAGWDDSIENFPWMLSMRRTTVHICSASIIAPHWTLTSAKCLVGIPAFQVTFRAGSTLRTSGGVLHQADQIVIHPDYVAISFEYDVAVVRVTQPFHGTNVRPIALADENVQVRDRAVANFAGWGVTNSGGFILPNILQSIQIQIISAFECSCKIESLQQDVTENFICAGNGIVDKCQMDQGGALVINNTLIGVASPSRNCGDSRIPGLYARISAPIIGNFIRNITEIGLID